jgi:tRNA-dihydrouridine synthase B
MYRSFLSPIFDYSDLAFRLQCQKYGAEATCIPLVNCEAVAREHSKISALDAHPAEKNLGVQLAGNNPETIGKTVDTIADSLPFVSWLNLNCGCPSRRMVECGLGSAMLDTPQRIIDAVRMMRKHAGIPISVKMRLKANADESVTLCRKLEEEGVDFIIIHGRRHEQGYSGRCDWELIRSVKDELSVPVVGNGDIGVSSEGRHLVCRGYCDSFMIGRAAIVDPTVFCGKRAESEEEKFRLLKEYISIYRGYVGEPKISDVKGKALNYLRGIRNAASLRNRISKSSSVEEIMEIL